MFRRLVWLTLLLSVLAAAFGAWYWLRESARIYQLTVAAGPEGTTEANFAEALARVVDQDGARFRLRVMHSRGPIENSTLVENGIAELGIVPGDANFSSDVSAVSFLFPQLFHLIVRPDSEINDIGDLAGKRIAVMPEQTGAAEHFLRLLEHYDLTSADLDVQTMDMIQAVISVRAGRVDAAFLVVPLGNLIIEELMASGSGQLIPIDQADALRLFQPALTRTIIPRGTYSGSVPAPPEDIVVAAVQSLLVAHDSVPDEIVRDLTGILYEGRSQLVRQTPQAALISRPEGLDEFGIGVHPGAERFYTKNDPPFVVEYAEPLAFATSVFVLLMSGLWQARLWLARSQKNRADRYNMEILTMIETIRDTDDTGQLESLRRHLFDIFSKVLVDLDRDQVTPESLSSFAFAYDVAVNSLNQRQALLQRRVGDQAGDVVEPLMPASSLLRSGRSA
ncbi:MAG: TAXI family TRAP transporter solute-binding subunit [Geminicoccaceae bacterium]